MPYAVAHVILTIVIADVYRDYFAKKKFPMIYVLFAGIAGLLPDMDVPAGWIFNFIFKTNYNFHRIYTHSLIYAILFFVLAIIFLMTKNEKYEFVKNHQSKSGRILHSQMYSVVFEHARKFLQFTINNKNFRHFRWNIDKRGIALFFLAMSFGWFMHIALDCTLAADGYLNFIPSIPLNFCPHPFSNQALAGFDAIILVLWLIHEQWKHDIKDYI